MDSLVSCRQKVDSCKKKKMQSMTRFCSWGKRQKKSSSDSLGSEKPPFPSPRSTLGPPFFFYAVSLRFLHFPFTSEPGLSLLWTGLTAVHIRAQNSMKKNGETYQSRICFTEVKLLVDSCDLPTLIGNILGKKNIYIYQTCACSAMIKR